MISEKSCANGWRHQGTLVMGEDPPPENEKAALAGGPLECAETERILTTDAEKVKARFCRPVAVADIARQILKDLGIQVETGSDFAERVARTKADAMRKGTL